MPERSLRGDQSRPTSTPHDGADPARLAQFFEAARRRLRHARRAARGACAGQRCVARRPRLGSHRPARHSSLPPGPRRHLRRGRACSGVSSAQPCTSRTSSRRSVRAGGGEPEIGLCRWRTACVLLSALSVCLWQAAATTTARQPNGFRRQPAPRHRGTARRTHSVLPLQRAPGPRARSGRCACATRCVAARRRLSSMRNASARAPHSWRVGHSTRAAPPRPAAARPRRRRHRVWQRRVRVGRQPGSARRVERGCRRHRRWCVAAWRGCGGLDSRARQWRGCAHRSNGTPPWPHSGERARACT